jgi:predicted peroxiredoxin
MRRTLIAAAIAAAIAPALAIGPGLAPEARAEDPARDFFYNITSDDAWVAGMALAQANVAADRGHAVTVFLNVRAVHLADRDAVLGTFGPAGKTPAELLAGLVGKGGSILVCGTCMRVGGMAEEDLIEGARVASPDLTFGALTAPDAVVLSY